MKILLVSDQIDPRIYSESLKERCGDVEFIISCGDLSYLYLEFIITTLNRPLYFVHGNHDPLKEISQDEPRSYPLGGENLHRRIIRKHGLLLAGVEGSILYNRRTSYQYSQLAMWDHVLRLVPGMLYNKLRYGRFLDFFVTHAPPKGVHEGGDLTHRGIRAFRWLIDTFKPAYHIHGHIHRYLPDQPKETRVGGTLVINAFGSLLLRVD
jgi:Icc-related predicted phosphoesterase